VNNVVFVYLHAYWRDQNTFAYIALNRLTDQRIALINENNTLIL